MVNGKALRDARGSRTQEQMAFDLDDVVVRETISAYETGRAKIAPDISRKVMKISQDAWYFIKILREFTGIGPKKPDGIRAAEHPAAWKEIHMREMEEAINSLREIDLSVPLEALQGYEIDDIRRACQQQMDVANSAMKFLATIDEHSKQIVMYEEWQLNYKKCVARGYYKEG